MSIMYCMSISSIGGRIISAAETFVGSIRAVERAKSSFASSLKSLMSKHTRSMSTTGSLRQHVVGYGRQTVRRLGQQQTVQRNQRRQNLKSTVAGLLEQANTPENTVGYGRQTVGRPDQQQTVQRSFKPTVINLLKQAKTPEKRAYLNNLLTDLDNDKISTKTAWFIIGTYRRSIRSCPDYSHVKIQGTLFNYYRRNNTAAEKTFIIRLHSALRDRRINDNEAVSLLESYRNYLSVKKDNPQMAKCPNFEEELALLRKLNTMETAMKTGIQ